MENEERNEEISVPAEHREIVNRAVHGIVYIILAVFCFSLGYRIGMSALPEDAMAVNETVMNTDADVMAQIWYEVCTEDDMLCLYKVSDSDRLLMASEEISSELFPYEDRRELKSGLIFESFEAAQASFEDFVS